jgi:hypothetical protein
MPDRRVALLTRIAMRHDRVAEDRRPDLTALLRAVLVALAIVVILPMPAAAAEGDPTEPPAGEPTPEPTPTPPPAPGIQRVFIYRSPAVVRQYTNVWCVPAAVQTMWNLIDGTSNARYARQKTLYGQIRRHNRYRYRTKGNDIQGWAWALRYYTDQPYRARAFVSKNAALRAIAEAIDRTGHPVGITVHHGTHAWVVLGYRAKPSATNPSQRTILGYYVSGPLGPGSRDPWRYRYMTMGAFRKVFGRYHERTRKVIWEDKYVLVTD